jgi:hypothetical protein
VVLDPQLRSLLLCQQRQLEVVLVLPLDAAQLELLLRQDRFRQDALGSHLAEFSRAVHYNYDINMPREVLPNFRTTHLCSTFCSGRQGWGSVEIWRGFDPIFLKVRWLGIIIIFGKGSRRCGFGGQSVNKRGDSGWTIRRS